MLSAYIHLRLLPQVWRRLVNSAGKKFQTSTIISETKTPLVVRLTPTPATYKLHVLNYQRRLISPFLSV